MLIEIIGWTGSVLILLAYALLSSGRLAARTVTYQLMNAAGGIGLALNGWVHMALPSVFNNVIWAIIGSLAIIQILRRPTIS